MKHLNDLAEAQALALAIVDTLPEPFLVLDEKLNLLAGSRCFFEIFKEEPEGALGRARFSIFPEVNGTFRDCGSCLKQLFLTIPRWRASNSSECWRIVASERSS